MASAFSFDFGASLASFATINELCKLVKLTPKLTFETTFKSISFSLTPCDDFVKLKFNSGSQQEYGLQHTVDVIKFICIPNVDSDKFSLEKFIHGPLNCKVRIIGKCPKDTFECYLSSEQEARTYFASVSEMLGLYESYLIVEV
jgi:hypothetical protein